MLKEYFEPKSIWEKSVQVATQERKVLGGSYEISFYFESFTDFIVLTSNGSVQVRGKDEYHVYVKPWQRSQFADLQVTEFLSRFSSCVESIEIKGCGNKYSRLFGSYEQYLNWLGFPQQMNLIDLEVDKEST